MRKFGELVGLFREIHSLRDIGWDTLEWQSVERDMEESSSIKRAIQSLFGNEEIRKSKRTMFEQSYLIDR